MSHPTFFGVRHLSPAGAWHLIKLLDEKRPKLVLVEGPSDLTPQLSNITRPETKPPIAILAYTVDLPVRTILYPFAEYSPEYQAILWCHNNSVKCRFMDLPSDVFLSMNSAKASEKEGEEERFNVYEALDKSAGEDGHETFWERTLEHTTAENAYHSGANAFGAEIRSLTEKSDEDYAENIVREAYMRRQLEDAIKEGFSPEDIVLVTGAYHVEGLKNCEPMSDSELASLPRVPANQTLMPYSYYRLSSRSGYGAGNKAPAYYSLLWESLSLNEPHMTPHKYMVELARYQRENGNPISSADVIEAVRLSYSLAELRGASIPALRDLRDAAITCLGHGSFASLAKATANTEIGTRIGALPEGVSRTSIQDDFYRQLKELKLDKYHSVTSQDLPLDLREDRTAKTEKTAFLDLERSFFLHRLRVLGMSFAKRVEVRQDSATWSEPWVLQWTPESEIELVESALKGDTVSLAASFEMKERTENSSDMGSIASVIEDAFTCGIPSAVGYATTALQSAAVDAAAVDDLGETISRLSTTIQYGSIRKLNSSPLEPILEQLFLRSILLLADACICDDSASKSIMIAIDKLNSAVLAHDFLDNAQWIKALLEISRRDDLNTRCSGFASAILLEHKAMTSEELSIQVERRLSKGVPADLGAGWFEGLAMKNRYALIARLSLWQSLSDYLDTLDDEEFKRALVFLRRAFADFSPNVKDSIAENLGEIFGLNPQAVSEAVNAPIPKEAEQLLNELDDFDFGDI